MVDWLLLTFTETTKRNDRDEKWVWLFCCDLRAATVAFSFGGSKVTYTCDWRCNMQLYSVTWKDVKRSRSEPVSVSLPFTAASCHSSMCKTTYVKLYEVDSSSYPPQMEDPLQLPVGLVQEAVTSGRPLLVNGRHGGHVALQAQEVLLHLWEHTGEHTQHGFILPCVEIQGWLDSVHAHAPHSQSSEWWSRRSSCRRVLGRTSCTPCGPFGNTRQKERQKSLSMACESTVKQGADNESAKRHCGGERRWVSHRWWTPATGHTEKQSSWNALKYKIIK